MLKNFIVDGGNALMHVIVELKHSNPELMPARRSDEVAANRDFPDATPHAPCGMA